MTDVAALLAQLPDRELLAAERARRHLVHYVRFMWDIIEPGTPYVHGWHIEAICEHLQAVTEGEIRNLLITMPPRHMKSITSSVMWPTWEWITRPEHKYLFTSYSGVLSVRDALKSRRIIQHYKYQRHWADAFQLTGDQNAKTRYENDHTGYRIATSVGGTATGEGGSRIVCDDPHNMTEIHSELVRESTLVWWDETMGSRLNNPKTDAKIIIMQRGHEADLAGHVMKSKRWEHLNLPAEFEGSKRKTFLGWCDPRTEVGELLWPERFGRAQLEELKEQLGEQAAAAQLQQRPAPAEGGIIKRAWFQLWPASSPLPRILYLLLSYDTSFGGGNTAAARGSAGDPDPTGCMVLGVFEHPQKKRKCVLLFDCWEEVLSWPALRKRVADDWHARYGDDPTVSKAGGNNKGYRPDALIVEDKSSGISLIQDLVSNGIPAIAFNPGTRDKVARMHMASPLVQAGTVYLLESTKHPGEPRTWYKDFLKQVTTFPNVEHDDMSDALSQALIYLRDQGLVRVELSKPPDIDPHYVDPEDRAPRRTVRANPYLNGGVRPKTNSPARKRYA